MARKIILICMSFLMFFSFQVTEGFAASPEITDLDIRVVKNFEEALDKYGLTENDITSSFSFEKTQGVINLYSSKDDLYYNFYVNNNKIEYQSIQTSLDNGNSTFDLYTFNMELIISEEITPDGDLVEKTDNSIATISKKPNKAALKWACIFGSYAMCVTIALGAGAAGSLVSGPFGAACRYVFQTLVEKYGSKEQACKILS